MLISLVEVISATVMPVSAAMLLLFISEEDVGDFVLLEMELVDVLVTLPIAGLLRQPRGCCRRFPKAGQPVFVHRQAASGHGIVVAVIPDCRRGLDNNGIPLEGVSFCVGPAGMPHGRPCWVVERGPGDRKLPLTASKVSARC